MAEYKEDNESSGMFTRKLGENGLKCSFPQLEGTFQRGEPAIRSASHPCFQGMSIIGRGSRSEIKSHNPLMPLGLWPVQAEQFHFLGLKIL